MISSSKVGVKINEWYKYIRMNREAAVTFYEKALYARNKFSEGIIFMKLKHASVLILAIVFIGFASIYLTSTQKDVQKARRGHTANTGYTDSHSFGVSSRGHTSKICINSPSKF